MANISRSEAIQRLHIIGENVRAAMQAVRADEWEESVLRAEMALDQLQKLTPWLEEASNNAPARPNVTVPEHIGGMGYRGSTGGRKSAGDTFSISGMPEIIPMPNRMPPTPLPDRDPTPPRPIQPRPAPAQHKPIITPPPPLPQPEEEVTFDLTRMPGQVPYIVACEDGPQPPLTEAELKSAKRFEQLPEKLQDKIKQKYVETGKPVTTRLRQGERNG
jgi:hypothetical protein